MVDLIYNNGIITFREVEYPYEEVEKIDDMSVHIHMGGQIICFLGNETLINGKLMLTADEIIFALNTSN